MSQRREQWTPSYCEDGFLYRYQKGGALGWFLEVNPYRDRHDNTERFSATARSCSGEGMAYFSAPTLRDAKAWDNWARGDVIRILEKSHPEYDWDDACVELTQFNEDLREVGGQWSEESSGGMYCYKLQEAAERMDIGKIAGIKEKCEADCGYGIDVYGYCENKTCEFHTKKQTRHLPVPEDDDL